MGQCRDKTQADGSKSWSNCGPRIGANRYFLRFWEPPASRIFDQLPVKRCSFTAATQISSPDEGVLMMLLDSFPSQLSRRLGEHRRWSQSGHRTVATLTS